MPTPETPLTQFSKTKWIYCSKKINKFIWCSDNCKNSMFTTSAPFSTNPKCATGAGKSGWLSAEKADIWVWIITTLDFGGFALYVTSIKRDSLFTRSLESVLQKVFDVYSWHIHHCQTTLLTLIHENPLFAKAPFHRTCQRPRGEFLPLFMDQIFSVALTFPRPLMLVSILWKWTQTDPLGHFIIRLPACNFLDRNVGNSNMPFLFYLPYVGAN